MDDAPELELFAYLDFFECHFVLRYRTFPLSFLSRLVPIILVQVDVGIRFMSLALGYGVKVGVVTSLSVLSPLHRLP